MRAQWVTGQDQARTLKLLLTRLLPMYKCFLECVASKYLPLPGEAGVLFLLASASAAMLLPSRACRAMCAVSMT